MWVHAGWPECHPWWSCATTVKNRHSSQCLKVMCCYFSGCIQYFFFIFSLAVLLWSIWAWIYLGLTCLDLTELLRSIGLCFLPCLSHGFFQFYLHHLLSSPFVGLLWPQPLGPEKKVPLSHSFRHVAPCCHLSLPPALLPRGGLELRWKRTMRRKKTYNGMGMFLLLWVLVIYIPASQARTKSFLLKASQGSQPPWAQDWSQEEKRGNSPLVWWYLKFWSSSSIYLLLFTFQSPQIPAPRILSKF